MQESDALFKMLERALHIVLEAPAPDWDKLLEKLDERIRKVESRRRAEETTKGEHAREESRKHDMEATLFASSQELKRAKEEFDRETRRQRELWERLENQAKQPAAPPAAPPPKPAPEPPKKPPEKPLPVMGPTSAVASLYAWKEFLAIGHPEIDKEHKNLFALINRLHGSVQSEGERSPSLGQGSAELIAHARALFRNEEIFMTTIGYPLLAFHKADHQRFMQELERFDGLSVRSMNSKLRFASEWMVNHILDKDKQIAVWWKENRKP